MSQSEQAYIQNWLNTLYPSLIQELPGLLKHSGFDPYGGPDGGGFTWNIGTIGGDAGVSGAQIVCGRVGAAKWPQQIWIPYPLPSGQPSTPSIDLSQSFVDGFSQITIPPYNASDPSQSGLYAPLDQDRIIVINAQFNNSVLVLRGSFTFYQNCCQAPSSSSQTCSPGATEQNLQAEGTYTATVATAAVRITLQITTLATDQLVVAANAVDFQAAATTGNINIGINITSVSDGHVQDYDQSADQVFNQNSTLATMVANLQGTLQDPHNMEVFGQEMTKELDSYLQSHNYYPYGPPFLGLV